MSNNNNTNEPSFTVSTGNIGLSAYMFMWGNSCGLNADGQAFIKNLQAQMNAIKDAAKNGDKDAQKAANEQAAALGI